MARKKAKKDKENDVQHEEILAEEIEQDNESDDTVADDSINEDAVEDNSNGEEPDIDELQKKAQDAQDKLLRMAAEFENYKKRMARERSNAIKYAEENILKDLLPTIDNLERALDQENNANDIQKLKEGIELTLKGLLNTVGKYDLTQLKSIGEPFDPNFHEALVMEASSEVPAQSIIREFEKGYLYKDRLLRAAKVIVSKGEED